MAGMTKHAAEPVETFRIGTVLIYMTLIHSIILIPDEIINLPFGKCRRNVIALYGNKELMPIIEIQNLNVQAFIMIFMKDFDSCQQCYEGIPQAVHD